MKQTAMVAGMGKRRAHVRVLALACVLGSTIATPASAYRTAEDSPAFAGSGRVGWSAVQVPFLLSESGLPPGLDKAAVEAALDLSLATWIGPACSTIEPFFAGWTDRVPVARDEQNTIAWVTDWEGRGLPPSAPGNSDIQYRGRNDQWTIAEADIYLNAADYSWTAVPDDLSATSAQVVLTHELGHALGLLHPCEPAGEHGAPACEEPLGTAAKTTMYPFYAPDQASLAEDDIAGLCYLYPTGGDCGECGAEETCIEGECRSSCGLRVCGAGEICGFWGCVSSASCTARDCTGRPCDTDDACGPLARCEKRICVRGTVEWGSACRANADCANGACLDGICQPDCQSDTECGPHGSCLSTKDGSARACISSGAYDQGMTCAAGEDCESGICIFLDNRARCTTECKTSDTCPTEWSCQAVEGRNVCVPPTYLVTGGGGCSLALNPEPKSSLAWLLLTAATLLVTRKRRTRNVI